MGLLILLQLNLYSIILGASSLGTVIKNKLHKTVFPDFVNEKLDFVVSNKLILQNNEKQAIGNRDFEIIIVYFKECIIENLEMLLK